MKYLVIRIPLRKRFTIYCVFQLKVASKLAPEGASEKITPESTIFINLIQIRYWQAGLQLDYHKAMCQHWKFEIMNINKFTIKKYLT